MNQGALRAFDVEGPRSATPPSGSNSFPQFARPAAAAGISAESVRAICDLRRRRQDMFPGKLLGDATWDVLLQLYAARLEMHRLSISRLTRLSRLPATTVLRRLGVLEREGLVIRSTDPYDGRRVYVALSTAGAEAMERCFAESGHGARFL